MHKYMSTAVYGYCSCMSYVLIHVTGDKKVLRYSQQLSRAPTLLGVDHPGSWRCPQGISSEDFGKYRGLLTTRNPAIITLLTSWRHVACRFRGRYARET